MLLRDARVARLCRFAGLISAGLGTAGGAACAGVAAPRPRCCCSSNWCCTFDSAFAAPAFAATGVAALVVACNCCRSCNDAGAKVCVSFYKTWISSIIIAVTSHKFVMMHPFCNVYRSKNILSQICRESLIYLNH